MHIPCAIPGPVCRQFGKDSGVFVGCGLLAIESALHLSMLPANSVVAIPRVCCWRIPAAILRSGHAPMLCDTDERLLLDVDRAVGAIEKIGAAAVIAVHQYGLPFPVQKLKQRLPHGVVVIEDAAQGWAIWGDGGGVGRWSDYVVTSFGPTKPVSFGYGGAVFSADPGLHRHFDMDVHAQQRRTTAPLPYGLPAPAADGFYAAFAAATHRVRQRRLIVASLREALVGRRWPRPWASVSKADVPAWHRVPLFFPTTEDALAFTGCGKQMGLAVQAPLDITMEQIPHLQCLLAPGGFRDAPPHVLISPKSDTVSLAIPVLEKCCCG